MESDLGDKRKLIDSAVEAMLSRANFIIGYKSANQQGGVCVMLPESPAPQEPAEQQQQLAQPVAEAQELAQPVEQLAPREEQGTTVAPG